MIVFLRGSLTPLLHLKIRKDRKGQPGRHGEEDDEYEYDAAINFDILLEDLNIYLAFFVVFRQD